MNKLFYMVLGLFFLTSMGAYATVYDVEASRDAEHHNYENAPSYETRLSKGVEGDLFFSELSSKMKARHETMMEEEALRQQGLQEKNQGEVIPQSDPVISSKNLEFCNDQVPGGDTPACRDFWQKAEQIRCKSENSIAELRAQRASAQGTASGSVPLHLTECGGEKTEMEPVPTKNITKSKEYVCKPLGGSVEQRVQVPRYQDGSLFGHCWKTVHCPLGLEAKVRLVNDPPDDGCHKYSAQCCGYEVTIQNDNW